MMLDARERRRMKVVRFASFIVAISLIAPAVAYAQTTSTAAPSSMPSPAASAPEATPAPGPSPTAAITARAKDWLHRVQTGNVDRSQLSAKMNSAFTDAQVKQVASQTGAFGDPTSFAFVDSRIVQGVTVYQYRAVFKSITATWIFALDSDGKIAGMFLRPAQ